MTESCSSAADTYSTLPVFAFLAGEYMLPTLSLAACIAARTSTPALLDSGLLTVSNIPK